MEPLRALPSTVSTAGVSTDSGKSSFALTATVRKFHSVSVPMPAWALPAASRKAPLSMVTEKSDPAGRLGPGSTVTVLPLMRTEPLSSARISRSTAPLASSSRISPLPASTGSLKLSSRSASTATPVPLSAGVRVVRVGAWVSLVLPRSV